MKAPKVLLFLLLLCSFSAFPQNDSVVFKNGDFIVGEIKEMTRAVLTFETPYSDSDFKIEWNGIAEIFGVHYFLIVLKDGTRLTGNFKSKPDSVIHIMSQNNNYETKLDDIVYIRLVDHGFWQRLHASIDFSLGLAKANNLQQLNTRSNIGYLSELWSVSASFATLISQRDDVNPTRRTDGSGSFSYFLPKDWYVPASISFLSNTEQKIDLRTNARLGFGKYIIHTNSAYWGFSGGLAYNYEKYANESNYRKSWEGFAGTELNLYDIGDFNLLTSLTVYPSITDKERFRYDFKIDTKYDLPLDFYIRAGFTVNYDKKPATGASNTDYVLESGIGWEL